jgi:putative transposase
MTRTRYKIYDEQKPYFLTMTVVEWIPLFINPEIVSFLIESLRFCQKERQLILYAYVIMEQHLHLVSSAHDLRKTIKEYKSFTARRIIDYLKKRNYKLLLEELRRAKLAHKTKSKYQLWQ